VKLIADKKTDNDGFYSSITGAAKVDDTTVNITTAKPDGVMPARMYWLKMIPAAAEKTEDLSDAPNGTGPYKFVSRTVGSDVQLVRELVLEDPLALLQTTVDDPLLHLVVHRAAQRLVGSPDAQRQRRHRFAFHHHTGPNAIMIALGLSW
jgi:hypothetical protein